MGKLKLTEMKLWQFISVIVVIFLVVYYVWVYRYIVTMLIYDAFFIALLIILSIGVIGIARFVYDNFIKRNE